VNFRLLLPPSQLVASSAVVQARPYSVYQTTPRIEGSLVSRKLSNLRDEYSRLVYFSTQDGKLFVHSALVHGRSVGGASGDK
jgi:hypothetical protein